MEVDMFNKVNQEVYVPDGTNIEEALSRTTHLAIAAHQDDIEIMAIDGILQGFKNPGVYFSGCVVTDGRGSPRAGKFGHVSDDDMAKIRIEEQKAAARLGKYSAQVFLGYPSARVKNPAELVVVDDLTTLFKSTQPQIIYTHNPADKHTTHVAVVLRVIQALRNLPKGIRPEKVYGCEVWRNLDWLPDEIKTVFDVSAEPELQAALIDVFESQVEGGKNYTEAIIGRRIANATFFASHATDNATRLAYALDLTPLIEDDSLDVITWMQGIIAEFNAAVTDMLKALS